MFRIAAAGAVLLLAINGVLSGVWSHRWEAWSDAQAQAAADRIEAIPLEIGDWVGRRVETDPLTHPEEVVGRGVTVQYVNRTDGTAVNVYLACGPADGLISHTPQACYGANGFTWVPPNLRVSPEAGEEAASQFWVSNFVRTEAAVPTYLRVFWAWSDGGHWQTPDNPRRTFRRSPVITKCYVIRTLTTLDEPIEGDPCLRLMAVLLPRLDAIASANP
jgi:hypothetical protein